MERPIVKLAIGGLLGSVASFSISLGLIPLIAAFAVVVIFGIAWRSSAALSGGLCGFGLMWLAVGGSTYANCLSMGPDCGGSESMVPFLVIAGVVFVTGVAVGLRGIVRDGATFVAQNRT